MDSIPNLGQSEPNENLPAVDYKTATQPILDSLQQAQQNEIDRLQQDNERLREQVIELERLTAVLEDKSQKTTKSNGFVDRLSGLFRGD